MTLSRMTVAQITRILNQENIEPPVIKALESDDRVSVVRLLNKWRQKKAQKLNEMSRLEQLYTYERYFYEEGYDLIAGIDEAGRGPLAGPVVVAAVILPHNYFLPSLNDSKKLSPKQRQELYHKIKQDAIAVSSWFVHEHDIDKLNIYQATLLGMYKVVENLNPTPHAILIDAMPLRDVNVPTRSIIDGDALSASIAAASIIAKVERDAFMNELDQQYPAYGFAKHKGYATAEHVRALNQFGPCPVHRRSFEPIKSWEGTVEDK